MFNKKEYDHQYYLRHKERYILKAKQWYNENKEHVKKLVKIRREKNKEQIKQYQKKWRKTYGRNSKLKQTYQITEKIYGKMLKKQKGVCAICGHPPKTRKLHVDHCHKTKRVRGLLCFNCNYALGRFFDDIFRLKNAVRYLQETQNVDWRIIEELRLNKENKDE